MRLTRRLTILRKATLVVLVPVAGAGALSLALTSADAAPKAPTTAPAAPTTPTVPDTTPPPEPVLSEKPADPTTSRNAHFRITDAEAGVTFRCRLDGGAYASCGPVANFNNLDIDEHCLDVHAADAAGNPSPDTRWCWSIILRGGFPVSGDVDDLFAPGVTQPLNLVIGNPYNFTIRVTAVTITVGATTGNEECAGPLNLTVAQGLTVPVDVPRNSTRSLQQLGVAEADWPRLKMPNLETDQDACKNATFSLAYTGEATKP